MHDEHDEHDRHGDHPMHRAWSPEDPMELNAAPVDGDPAVMLDCVIEEYVRQGWGEAEVMGLFTSPGYRATHELTQLFGEEHVRQRVQATSHRMGTLRFKVTYYENCQDEHDDSFSV